MPALDFEPSTDMRSFMPRFTHAARRTNWPLVELLTRVGQRHEASPAQVALAWLMARDPVIVPIPGTTRVKHLDENLRAASVRLDAADLAEIERGFASLQIQGARSTSQLLAMHDDGATSGRVPPAANGKTPLPPNKRKSG